VYSLKLFVGHVSLLLFRIGEYKGVPDYWCSLDTTSSQDGVEERAELNEALLTVVETMPLGGYLNRM
jgi:hypothetical protein